MNHQQIVDNVARRAELPTRRSAEHALRAVLETLAERISPSSALALAEKLPVESGVYLQDVPPARPSEKNLESFLDRIAGRLALTRPDATRVSRAVISVIGDAAGEEAIRRPREELPFEWRVIFESRRYPIPVPVPSPRA